MLNTQSYHPQRNRMVSQSKQIQKAHPNQVYKQSSQQLNNNRNFAHSNQNVAQRPFKIVIMAQQEEKSINQTQTQQKDQKMSENLPTKSDQEVQTQIIQEIPLQSKESKPQEIQNTDQIAKATKEEPKPQKPIIISEEAKKREQELNLQYLMMQKLLYAKEPFSNKQYQQTNRKDQTNSKYGEDDNEEIQDESVNLLSDEEDQQHQGEAYIDSSLIDQNANFHLKNRQKGFDGFQKLICPLCLKFMYKCTSAVCGHSFCEKCLDEYLIIRESCFVCDEFIKKRPLQSCFSIDNVIDQLVLNSQNKEQIEIWEKQKLDHKTWTDQRKLKNVEVGDLVDMRDNVYIWCVATVTMKIEKANKEPLLIVHYEGWNNYYDEFVKISSIRLAPLGFYTSRNDIPKYQLKQENAMTGDIINRIPPKKVKDQQVENKTSSNQGSKSENQSQKKEQIAESGTSNNQALSQEQKDLIQMRREANAHIGDTLYDKIDEYFDALQRLSNGEINEDKNPRYQVYYVRNYIDYLNKGHIEEGGSIIDQIFNDVPPSIIQNYQNSMQQNAIARIDQNPQLQQQHQALVRQPGFGGLMPPR
ncbi:zinc binding [Stylonychia lemnae]|uniref:Zinc binding n=1 Tax=Stylonychia lemnae TaxID=5949 RepID=A0A078ATV7_STYLE|nr:zinc binding [Stylonychia lemnae]|eukprot:CDW85689.1 zinc binding [Stylonychia lemnae]